MLFIHKMCKMIIITGVSRKPSCVCNQQMRVVMVTLMTLAVVVLSATANNIRHRRSDVIDDGE